MSEHFVSNRPLLTLNQRLHWARKAEITRTLRVIGAAIGRHYRGSEHVTVGLVWKVSDRRRRDAENPTPTLKALCDGLVDAGVVPDDTPRWMTKLMPEIRLVDKGMAGVYLTVERTEAVRA